MLMFSQKGTVELDVEEGTMRFAGRKVGTLKYSKSKDGNRAGLGRVTPILFPFPINLFYPVPGSNPVPGSTKKKISQPRSRPAPSNC